MTGQTVFFANRPDAEREAELDDDQSTLVDWLQLVRSEYLEMPGLHLTKRQVQRLWNLDDAMCEALLTTLIDGKFLKRTADGAYARADGGIG